MPFRRAGLFSALILTASLALSGCDSAEERAEKHFQSGMELLEAGDVDRALVEFRNVFKLNGQHKEARLTYARIQRERGLIEEAYGQYLRLIEQYPDNLEGRRALGEMAIGRLDWAEATRHVRAARDLAPDDSAVIAMNAALDYRQALLGRDELAAAQAVAMARTALEQDPDLIIARRVVIDQLMREAAWPAALAEIGTALERDPGNLSLHGVKLKVLAVLQDQPGIGAHLQVMFALFPENQHIRQALIFWYVQNDDPAGAEAFLRRLTETDDPVAAEQARVDLVQFLLRTAGPAAARAELDRLVETGGNPVLYRSLRASINFDSADDAGGDTGGGAAARAGAIAEMEAILQDAPPSEQTRNMKTTLARMLEATGNHVGARARVEEILAEDPSHVAALKMRAAWLIAEDRPGEAVTALRMALDQDPRDAGILTLMAEAHLRDGSRQLAGERLALAVEVSGQRAAESLQYAAFLAEDARLSTAETVLLDAQRRAPADVPLLAALGDLYLRMADWPRVDDVVQQLERIGTDEARNTANRARVVRLFRQQKFDESIALLQQLADQSGSGLETAALIVRTQLQNGKLDQAEAYLDALLAEHPQDDRLLFLRAGVHAIAGETDRAEALYRALAAKAPASAAPVRALYGMLRAAERPDAARKVLDEGLAASGNAPELLLLKAGLDEAEGDIEGAIAIYEELYAQNSANPVLANNLASLIASHREDAESLERAFAIARRLRGATVPAFQDTYGWIEYRRGNYDEALAHLEPAAAGLPEDPLVQLHLGLTYVALERIDEARSSLVRALDIAADSPLPQFARAREVLAGLPAAPDKAP
ncbi:MAG TPA: tetratricopeptide repeat protein [Paracoccaceae bacterium]